MVKDNPSTPDLRQFTQDFFTFFGATVKTQGRKKLGPLAVQLPPELTEHFGKAELTLAFQQSELTHRLRSDCAWQPYL